MNKKLQVLKYVFFDIFSAILAWTLFFIYRKYNSGTDIFHNPDLIFNDRNLYLGLVIVTFFWFTLYFVSGTYQKIYRKSRLRELSQTFILSFLGLIVIFFLLILDDQVISYKYYYQYFIIIFALHFTLTFAFRFILSSRTAHRIHKKIIGFNTLLIGSNGNATAIYNEIENEWKSSGNKFVGFVDVFNGDNYPMKEYLPHLGNYKDLKNIILKYEIEEVIIAIDKKEHSYVEQIISFLEDTNVVIKIIADMKDFLLGSVKMTSIFHAPLIQISPELMPAWQRHLKRFIDIFASITAILILLPFYLIYFLYL